jgi:hypothetical protein
MHILHYTIALHTHAKCFLIRDICDWNLMQFIDAAQEMNNEKSVEEKEYFMMPFVSSC